MAVNYSEKLKKRIIDGEELNWDDEGRLNEYINEVALAGLLSANRIESGGEVTDAGGLLVNVAAVSGRFGEDHFSLPGDTLNLSAAQPGEEQSNWIYIDATPQLQVSTVPPTGNYIPLSLVETDDMGVLRISEMAPLAQPVEGVVENDCINGTFDVWQRATSQSTSGYGSDDRFANLHSGSTKEHSQQAFAPGQTEVPGNPNFFSRTVVTSAAGAGNYVKKVHRILDVTKYSGKRVVVKIHGRADVIRNIAVEGVQNFGSGGSVSVEGISAQLVELDAVWGKRVAYIDFPEVSGMTVGDLSYSEVAFWFDAGTEFGARTADLGQQSGVFDITEVEIYVSDKELPCRRPTVEETYDKCLEYYWKQDIHVVGTVYHASYAQMQRIEFPRKMVTIPAITFENYTGLSGGNGSIGAIYNPHVKTDSVNPIMNWSNGVPGEAFRIRLDITIDAEI